MIRPLTIALFISCSSILFANDDPASEVFFENRIRPALVEHCYECHSLESGKSKGGLRLDTRNSIRSGGDTGAAVIPKKPDESLLLTAILHEELDLEMPPKKPKLPKQVLDDFEAWIKAGAYDPRSAAAGAQSAMATRLEHWSYKKPVAPDLPKEADWPKSNVDRFVYAKLVENEMQPSPDADERVLVRRLYFDLIGIPPTPEQAAAFSFANLEETVDKLLDSAGFGVRWGRHWLDVVRFAESNGREANIVYPHAWRYRDYVIDAVNRDVPYDRFLHEQLAGDLLPFENDADRARLLIATGFLAFGAKGLSNQDKPQFAADLVDEQLDALSRGFLASSIACARCHDHKTAPVTMQDYYALIGIFRSTKTHYGTWIDSENNNASGLIELPDLPGQLKPGRSIPPVRLAKMKAQLAELETQSTARDAMATKMSAEDKEKMMRENFNEILKEVLRIYWTKGGLVGKLAAVDDDGNPLPLCMGAMEANEMIDSPVYIRGDLKHPTDEAKRGVPALFGMKPAAADDDQSGRLALAHWLTDADNPLTARVMANRIWSHLFGAGIVQTTDNFGPTGEAPSHPQLLDYLAVRFQENGWSVKQLVREIALSRAYRQSSTYRADHFNKDPDNRLIWRANKRRLDAESIRDSMLLVSGELDLSPRPASLAAELNRHSVSLVGFDKSIPADLDGSKYRSVYLPVLRDNLPDVLSLFDFAEPSLVVGNRDETNVPPQALYLMNSDFVLERADALAQRIIEDEQTLEARIQRAFEICFNRRPDPEEATIVSQFFKNTNDTDDIARFSQFCQALLSSAEFRIAD